MWWIAYRFSSMMHEVWGRQKIKVSLRQDVSSIWFLCKQEASLVDITNQACALFNPTEVAGTRAQEHPHQKGRTGGGSNSSWSIYKFFIFCFSVCIAAYYLLLLYLPRHLVSYKIIRLLGCLLEQSIL
ncbi:uncharacterized protein LOC130815851 isoform X2 [Amaranthus tricolor]|uniref:uncharacterized protein LOC130815851 isoform X2 n=1 Tax=Amaranthus tricolor TaxID=29722 RepID=UPI00258D025D|nr:uncharacterized protein LOC130815851 isoform X2 [Amaranthus tricolor]